MSGSPSLSATEASSTPLSAPLAVPPPALAIGSLYVGDLAPDVTEALLFDHFNHAGQVASVRVCRDSTTKKSLGYAYVNFSTLEAAERALDTLNFSNIRNKPCRIMWSHRDPAVRKSGLGNIFVRHLAKTIDNKLFYDNFSPFGNILSCKLQVDKKGGETLGYGFVHYESDEAAVKAIEAMNGKELHGQVLEVCHFKSRAERAIHQQHFTNVFVKNLPGEMTKEQLDGLFGEFGAISSSFIAKDRADASRAYGFVNFENPQQANAAVQALNEKEVDGKRLFVGPAQKKEDRDRQLREQFESNKLEQQRKYANVNLYVKNLADDFDDKKLTEEFSKFGNITKAAVMVDHVTKKSRGFGFVCFSTPDEATRALTEMNGKPVEGKPLYVSIAQRKDQRKAQLEAQHAARAKMAGGGGAVMPSFAPPNMAALFYAQNMPSQSRAYHQMPFMGQRMFPMGGMPWTPGMNPAMRPGGVLPNYSVHPMAPRGLPQGVPANVQMRGVPRNLRQAQPGQRPQGLPAGLVPAGLAKPPHALNGQLPVNGQIRYAENVRNKAQSGLPAGAPVPSDAVPAMMPNANEPLTIQALASAPDDVKKQLIGERLFPLIRQEQPQLAGKITGMLLEMDNGELIHLLEHPPSLKDKIEEALQVLEANKQQQDDQQDEQQA